MLRSMMSSVCCLLQCFTLVESGLEQWPLSGKGRPGFPLELQNRHGRGVGWNCLFNSKFAQQPRSRGDWKQL
ncbi:hypothetical protein BKA80DRAFT_277915 [Phyllosticta citrichinensis]